MSSSRVQPFDLHLPASELEDLRGRLTQTRLADPPDAVPWSLGTDVTYLRELVDYWASEYDWRAHEAVMNRFDHFYVEVDGTPLHFVHARSAEPGAIPLLLLHGWPWTFWDFQHLIEPLRAPTDGQPAFNVVLPSLPGYGFSTPLRRTDVNVIQVAEIFDHLMTDLLGYPDYLAHGGDWGAVISTRLGHARPSHLRGIHITLPIPVPLYGGKFPKREDYGAGEEDWADRNHRFLQTETGYSVLQSTKPESLAVGMHDSPAALAAWLVEKRRTWSDCDGDVEQVFTKDDLLTNATIYWATRSFGSAARLYFAERHHPWRPESEGRLVEVPTGVCVAPRDVLLLPRRWVERRYNLHQWSVLESGGHFVPMEAPRSLTADLRRFAGSL